MHFTNEMRNTRQHTIIQYVKRLQKTFGGVAQWVGCRSWPADFPCPGPNINMAGRWPLKKTSTSHSTMNQPTKPTQPSIPPGSINE